MDWQEIFNFLTQGNGERVAGIVFAFLLFAGIIGTLIGYIINIIFDFFKAAFTSFKRKEKIIEVPKYVTPPKNEEIDKYIALLKKIVDDHNKGIKL